VGYEIEFLPVGESSGDAILVRYGDERNGYAIHLIDGAYTDTAERIIKHLDTYYGERIIDHMILSHADDDHATGLIEVLKNCVVSNLWMNRPWLHAAEVVQNFHGNYTVAGLASKMRELHPYLIELESIALRRRIPIHPTFQGAQIGAFTVLAPSRERYISLIPELDKTPTSYAPSAAADIFGGLGLLEKIKAGVKWIKETWQRETLVDGLETSASNETCLVQWAQLDGHNVLLTADVGPKGLQEAAHYAYQRGILVPPQFVQVPHHGSRHNVSKSTLNWWLGEPLADPTATTRGVAYCSVGEGEKAEEYPRKVVSNAFLRRGYPVHVTRGISKRHYYNMPARNWGKSEPLPFSSDVEG
jgi:hypothetical protein